MHISRLMLLLIVAGPSLLISCSRDKNHFRTILNDSGEIIAIHPSGKEIERAGIKYQSLTRREVKKEIDCPGTIEIAAEKRMVVSSPASGTVKSVLHFANEYVKAGTVVAILENTDFITLEKDFLEARNQLEYMHEEYTRQGDLTVENATSLKNMQIARREYQSAELQFKALSKQIKMLGLDPDDLNTDHLTGTIPIYAPRSGNLSGNALCSGLFVEKGTPLFELVNRHDCDAKIRIPEEFALHIEPGLNVQFWVPQDSSRVFHSFVKTLSPVIDPASHSIYAFAEISHPTENLLPGLSIRARIENIHDTACFVPAAAISFNRNKSYVFAVKDGYYYRIPVKTGIAKDSLVELIAFPKEWSDSVIIDGFRYLDSWFK